MPHQGPELPPHLAKRKRSIDDAEPPNSPPHKVQAATAPHILGPALPPSKNPDEVNIDGSSEDDYGPPPQPNRAAKQSSPPPPPRVQGPALPSKNPEELDLGDESSEDDYGPTPQTNPSKPPPGPPKRVLGPSLPPAPLSTMPSNPPDASSSDSDDDYAPALPPAPGSLAERQLQLQQQANASSSLAASSSEAPKQRRAEWMLVPPSADSSSRGDPTQLKARKFASSRGGGSGPADKSVSAIWTETPEEKRRRLEDEVLGRVEAATSSASAKTKKKDSKSEREDAETERRIREYNERNRGTSLYEAHKERGKEVGDEEAEDDPSRRAFDREKDMALGGRLGHGQKREMLAKAADFGSRFQKGKYL
jgi:hypothetical protein